ncbi:MAG TPA: TRAP transporter small permease subunit [Candidatus Limnocylindria bacterium]|jgi:TRAP-type mannitol/chloroaromatic compound transport system permease small subunit|nr:TRAP transporter small permease subunit [Candidatus Limnocylindria bacterium]
MAVKEGEVDRYLFWVDRVSTWTGKAFGWLVVVLAFFVSWDVLARKFFDAPLAWAYDGSYILYGTIFMMAGAYTLARNAHVRGDIFYTNWPVRTQAAVDLLLYLLFFFPGIIFLVWGGIDFAELSWRVQERSTTTSGGPPVYQFKTVLPIAAVFLLAQGVVETIRAALALRSGVWPRRLGDVEETETKLAQQEQL